MDAAIADTINRQFAVRFAAHLDGIDALVDAGLLLPSGYHWYNAPIADTLMGTNDTDNSDRAWLIGQIASSMPGNFDGPADEDWENLFSTIRAEILARRDPESNPRRAVEIPVGGVV